MLVQQALLADLYPKYEGIIHQRARQWANQYRGVVDYDDLIGHAKVIFCEAVRTYDVSRGQLSTHLWHELGRLNDFCRSEARHRPVEYDHTLLPAKDDTTIDLFEQADLLGGDAGTLLHAILNGELDPQEKDLRRRLPNCCKAEREMRASRGWSIHRTRKAWQGLSRWYRAYLRD